MRRFLPSGPPETAFLYPRLQAKTRIIRGALKKLFAFGSAIRDDFRPGESDVDLLVEFAPIGGHAKGQAYFKMLDELQQLLGSRVDLVMNGAVRNVAIAREIEKTKQMIYDS